MNVALTIVKKLKKYRATLALLFAAHASFGADPIENFDVWNLPATPEEMIYKFASEKDTTHLYFTLHYINQNFSKYKSESFFKLLMQCAERSEKTYPSFLPHFYRLIRKYYIQAGNKTKSLEYALKIYHLLSKTGNQEDMLWTMVEIGNIFFSEKDYDQAMVFYQKGEEIAIGNRDDYGLSVVYMNYGMVEDQRMNYERAIRYYKKSAKHRIRAGNVKFLASTYIKLANTMQKLGRRNDALHYIHLTEEYYYSKGKASNLLGETPMFIAMAYSDYYRSRADYEKAQHYLLEARELARQGNYMIYYYGTFFSEAEQLISSQKYDEAIECLLPLIPEFRKKGLLEDQRNAYRILTECYLKTKDIGHAESAFRKFTMLNDTLAHSALKSQLNTMRTLSAVYENDSKMENIRRNLQIADVNNQMQSKQKSIFYWIFGIATFTILVLLFLFLNLRKNKQKLQQLHFQSLLQNNEIKIKSIELQRSDQIKDKLFSIIAHDLRNPLNRLLVELAIVKKAIGNNKIIEPMENTLKETIGLFERLLQWSKMDNKQNIYSPVKINLSENINKIITFYLPEMQLREITIVNNSETLMVFVDPNILQTLLRNFLSNAISVVGKGGTIEIETNHVDDDSVEIILSDSGPGFPEEILNNFHVEKNDLNASNNGLGLTLCKVLAKMSGWPLRISNESKYAGARISIVLPIFKEKKRSAELNVISRAFQPTAEWKAKLKPILGYKFYQTSQIRAFLKSLGSIDDPQVRLWIKQIEQAVHQGDKDTFASLMELIAD